LETAHSCITSLSLVRNRDHLECFHNFLDLNAHSQ
jgi:hypothetical protein